MTVDELIEILNGYSEKGLGSLRIITIGDDWETFDLADSVGIEYIPRLQCECIAIDTEAGGYLDDSR